MKFLFDKKTSLFYILSVSVLTTVVFIYYLNTRKAIESSDIMLHSQEVIGKNNEVLFGTINIETGFRGFLLSGDEKFLESYNSAKAKTNTDIDQLAKLTANNPKQQSNILILKKDLNNRILFTEEYLDSKEQSFLNNTDKIAIIEKGKMLTDNIRHTITNINNEEFRLFALRKAENVKNNQFSEILFLLLIVFIITIFFLASIIMKKQKEKNIQLETATADQKLASQYSLSLIEASLDPLVTISVKGKIMDTNQATVNIIGVEKKELIGSDFFEYFTEPQKAREVYQEVFARGSVADSPLTIQHKDGKLTDVLFNGSVYKDDKENILGVVIVARDIAEQKWALDLRIANKELAFQNKEKEKRANELSIANEELAFQNKERENRANELVIANEELAFQNKIKEKRAAELVIANKELAFQNDEKEKRAAELVIADIELDFQNKEKEKRETANKELEKVNNSLKLASKYARSLIEASLDPLVTINAEGKITDVNNALIEVTGVERKILIGTNFSNYFTEPEKAQEGYRQAFEKGYVEDYPLTLKHINGDLIDVLYNASVYTDDNGNVLGVFAAARDITEQKKIETELVEAKVFAEYATAIAEEQKRNAENATAIAENAVKAKQQFLSNMSHEIRTPMNAIIGFTKVVLKTDLSDKQKEYLSAIKMSGDALIVLINDILDLAKVDAGKMTFEKIPFKLSASISAMLHVFETKIQEKNLELVTEYDNNIPKVLLGDPVRLHQIILNLVSNAIKFTSKGKITVSIRLLDEDAESTTIEFAVADTGIGIEESKIETIFDDFQQATSNTSRLYGGTGLGLAIVKQLVEPQGGSISVKSVFGEGSTFSFILNFQKTTDEAGEDTEILELDSEINSIKVLVVEDIPLNQLLMKTLLDEFGFERDIAENGKIAIEKLKIKSYDVILMDLQMPVMNGFEATKYIRNTLKLDIPIIALTADVTTVDLAKCKEVGMNDYIAKPVDERVLYSKIVSFAKKPESIKSDKTVSSNSNPILTKCINLDYLNTRTKSNPKLMMEMIALYLEQTPPILNAMKQSMADENWPMLSAAAHKIIPSFSIMGINPKYENMTRKIQECSKEELVTEEIKEMVLQVEKICLQACEELKIEYNLIKNT